MGREALSSRRKTFDCSRAAFIHICSFVRCKILILNIICASTCAFESIPLCSLSSRLSRAHFKMDFSVPIQSAWRISRSCATFSRSMSTSTLCCLPFNIEEIIPREVGDLCCKISLNQSAFGNKSHSSSRAVDGFFLPFRVPPFILAISGFARWAWDWIFNIFRKNWIDSTLKVCM